MACNSFDRIKYSKDNGGQYLYFELRLKLEKWDFCLKLIEKHKYDFQTTYLENYKSNVSKLELDFYYLKI